MGYSYLYIFLGGGVGALCRYVLSAWGNSLLHFMPFGTLMVNLIGCFIAGFVYHILLQYEFLRLGLGIGFLGALTTFSTFSVEVIQLLQDKKFLEAGLYWSISTVLCIAFAFLGVYSYQKL